MRTYWAIVVPKTTTPEESYVRGFGEMPTVFVEQKEAVAFGNDEGFDTLEVAVVPAAALKRLVDEYTHLLSMLGECAEHDHHGNCQTHFIERPCSVAVSRLALSEWKGGAE